MKNSILSPLILAAVIGVSLPAMAQTKQQQMDSGAKGGAAAGAVTGAVGGAIVGGPVGAVVGGAAGAVVGAVGGATTAAITADDRVYVQRYVVENDVPSVRYEGDIAVGQTLPGTVTYYRIENNPRLESYRYAHVNQRYVLVDGSNRVVTVIR
jgi:uncharacterized membrane protein